MSVVKQFECEHCGAEGKVTLKGQDYNYNDITSCPVCGGSIWEEDEDLGDQE